MDLSEQQGGLDEADKYEQLLRQERELTTFIEGFDSSRAATLNDIAAKQANTTGLLEKVSRHLQLQGNMPNQKRFKEMQDELEYKKQQVHPLVSRLLAVVEGRRLLRRLQLHPLTFLC